MGEGLWRWFVAGVLAAFLAGCQTTPRLPALTAEQVQVLRAHGFETQEDGAWALLMPSKLLFAVDSDQLNMQQAGYVAALAKDLRQVGIQTVRVEGHTDDTGAPAYNQQLSERRAQRVADQLVHGGLPASGISIRGWGNSKPLPMVQGQGARQENRRVSIIIPAPVAP